VIASVDRNTAAITAQVGDASYEAIRELNLNLLNNPEFSAQVELALSR
jgi:hypothetical protein